MNGRLLTINHRFSLLCVACFALLPKSGFAQTYPIQSFTEPNVTVQVAFSQPGKLTELNVAEGDRVTKGTLMASLDDAVLEIMQQIAKVRAQDESALDVARAEVEILEQRLNDLSSLVAAGGSSPQEVRRVATALKVAAANLRITQRDHQINQLEVVRLEAEREQRQLRAPVDGYIVEVHRQPGEYVSSGSPEVFELVQLDPLKIRFYMPVEEAARLQSLPTAPVWLPQLKVSVDAKLDRIADVIDPESGTLLVQLLLPNPGLKYRSGLRCEIRTPSKSQDVSKPISPKELP